MYSFKVAKFNLDYYLFWIRKLFNLDTLRWVIIIYKFVKSYHRNKNNSIWINLTKNLKLFSIFCCRLLTLNTPYIGLLSDQNDVIHQERSSKVSNMRLRSAKACNKQNEVLSGPLSRMTHSCNFQDLSFNLDSEHWFSTSAHTPVCRSH